MDPALVEEQEELAKSAEKKKSRDPSKFSLGYTRHESDFYPTPKSLRMLLTENIDLPKGAVWEPCVGDGALAKALEEKGYTVYGTDLRDVKNIYGRGNVDFLEFIPQNVPKDVTSIVTNPPFSHLTQFMKHGIEILESEDNNVETLILLARQDHHFSTSRLGMFAQAFTAVHSTWRAIWIPGSKGNPRWAHIWWQWKKGYTGPPAMRFSKRPIGRTEEFDV